MQSQASPGLEEYSFEDYRAIIRRRKTSLVLIALLFGLLGVAVALLLPSVYQSSATILIEEQEIPQDFVMATVTSYAEQRLQIIKQQIMSTSRLLAIIREFDLYADLRDRWTTDEIIEKMREDIGMQTISAEVMDRRTGRAKSVTIAFTLSYEGKDPVRVQQVANKLTSLYLEENLKVRKRKTLETSKFLEEEAKRVAAELRAIQDQISEFKEAHINQLPEMLQVNLNTLSDIERQSELLNEELRSLREREGYLEAQLSAIPPNQAYDTDQRRLEELKVQLVNLKSRFSDKYPDVIKVKREIAELEQAMAKSPNRPDDSGQAPDNPAYVTLASQLSSTRSNIRSVQRQIGDMRKKAGDYQSRIEAGPGLEREYNAMLMERQSLTAKLNDLKRKAMEAQVAHGLEEEQKGERFTLIDPARFPEKPFKPNRLAIILIGLVLGMGAGVGGAAVREFSDHSVYKADSLFFHTGLPVLYEIPEIVTKPDIRRRRLKTLAVACCLLIGIGGGAAAFHHLVMDLDVCKARVVRKLDRYQLLPDFMKD